MDSLLSGLPPVVPRRRLRLTWNPSHSGPQVQAVDRLFSVLAARIGSVPQGAEAPARLRRQRWSSVNVPLMWAAAGSSVSTPVLNSSWGWLRESGSPSSSKRIGCKPQKHCGQVGSLSMQCSGVGASWTMNISLIGWRAWFSSHTAWEPHLCQGTRGTSQ